MEKKVSIWWIRRDMRLADNPALHAANQHTQEVIPLFIADPVLIDSPSMAPQRIAFLWQALQSLDDELKKRGNRLVLRSGKPEAVLSRVIAETGAGAIFAHADFSPYARKRDNPLANSLPIQWVGYPTVHPPGEVRKDDSSPYTVFGAYMRKWREKPLPARGSLLPAPEKLPRDTSLLSEPLPSPPYTLQARFPAAEMQARQRLARFTQEEGPIYTYHLKRDMLNAGETSQLSPYLKFGLLSAREAVLAALHAVETSPDAASSSGPETWFKQLIWREFYASILHHFPTVMRQSFRPELDGVPWRDDEAHFSAWSQGLTGYPIVDAGMRELLACGWMHNRARMITASFLVKNLLISWQWGERWFMKHLLDGDPASNNGGWQWTAGTGTDAAPYFRIFNPILQSRKFDPHGAYIRRWVPELALVPDRFIHTPWQMSEEIQKKTACVIGEDYPNPIVDLKTTRERALHAYAFAKDQYHSKSIK